MTTLHKSYQSEILANNRNFLIPTCIRSTLQ